MRFWFNAKCCDASGYNFSKKFTVPAGYCFVIYLVLFGFIVLGEEDFAFPIEFVDGPAADVPGAGVEFFWLAGEMNTLPKAVLCGEKCARWCDPLPYSADEFSLIENRNNAAWIEE